MEELLLKRVLPEMMRGILSDRDEGLGNCLMVHRMMEGCCFYMLEAMVFFLLETSVSKRNFGIK